MSTTSTLKAWAVGPIPTATMTTTESTWITGTIKTTITTVMVVVTTMILTMDNTTMIIIMATTMMLLACIRGIAHMIVTTLTIHMELTIHIALTIHMVQATNGGA